MKTGLFSVTFRPYTKEKIVDLTAEAGLDSLLWGGDVHVRHGDSDAASAALALCRARGIDTDVYGSYYRVDGDGFDAVTETAKILGSNVIRVWAGKKGSADTTDEERAALVAQLRRDAETAKKHGMTLAFEYHGGTLTDNADSALRLIEDAAAENVRLHWQPNQYRDFDFNVNALRKVAPYVDAVHVFAWVGNDKFPLSTQENEWRHYFGILGDKSKCSSNCSLAAMEFVPVECREDLLRDAETLHRILGK